MDATFDRTRNLARLGDEHFDVLVIGGGITGCGVALDAATRGLSVALVDKDDWASGTSSKSSKMVHGGLRYLQNGDVRLVYEALRERQRLLRNAPHLVSVLPFLIPMFGKGGVIHPKLSRALGSAMWMYDLTGGARIGKLHKRIDRDETLEFMPTLEADRLGASYLYFDAQADDARLTLALARTAATHGAVCVNHCPVVELTGDGGRVTGAVVVADGDRTEVRARVVVNATGVWADTVRSLDEADGPDSIRPAKGVHITVPWHLVRNRIAVVTPVPKDKRSVFVVPWPTPPGEDPAFTYIGTTDTDYDGPLDDPRCTEDDITYLLEAINNSVSTTIGRDDVVGIWAGLRPLVKTPDGVAGGRTADLSRNHAVTTSARGVITVTGGKLTTYREMAEDTVEVVAAALDLGWRQRRLCRTRRLRLVGAAGFQPETSGLMGHLQRRHGGLATDVLALIRDDPTLGEPLVEGLPYVRAEAVHAVRVEMATTLEDVLARRTRALLLDAKATMAAADDVATLIGRELGWDQARQREEVEAFRSHVPPATNL